MVNRPEFRGLLNYLNPEIDNWLPFSPHTIKEWTMRTFETQKLVIKQELQSALSKIHFTVDLWTSPNSLAILGAIAHYITESGQLQHSVLALQEVDGEHTGENMSKSVMDVIEDYSIASKVGYFVMDNATNNDTMMRALALGLYIYTSIL